MVLSVCDPVAEFDLHMAPFATTGLNDSPQNPQLPFEFVSVHTQDGAGVMAAERWTAAIGIRKELMGMVSPDFQISKALPENVWIKLSLLLHSRLYCRLGHHRLFPKKRREKCQIPTQ